MSDQIPGPGQQQPGWTPGQQQQQPQHWPGHPPAAGPLGPEAAATQTYDPRYGQQQPVPPAQQGEIHYAPTQPAQPSVPQQAAYPPPQYPAPGPQAQGYPPQTGYPPQNYPQPVGYPQPQHQPPLAGYPVPQPSTPKRGLSGGAIGGIIAAGVVIACIAGAVVILNNADSSASAGAAYKSAWTVGNGADSGSDELVGGWLTSTLIVRAGSLGVSAYNLSNGSTAWTLPAPQGTTQPCAISPTLSAGGIGTIAFGTSTTSCSLLTGVDSSTGKILWTIRLTDSQNPTPTAAQTYVQGSVATVIAGEVFGGVDVATGRTAWNYTNRSASCADRAYGTTGVVLVVDDCYGSSPENALTAVDGVTGKVEWQHSESSIVDFDGVIAAEPVVGVESGDSGDSALLFDNSGNTTPFQVPDALNSPTGPFSDSGTARVVGQNLIVQSQGLVTVSGGGSTGGTVEAYNISTGALAWSYSGESKYGAELVAPSPDGVVYAMSTGSDDGTPHLVRLDPVTGKSTIIGRLTGTSGFELSEDDFFILPGGGVVYLGSMGDDVEAYH